MTKIESDILVALEAYGDNYALGLMELLKFSRPIYATLWDLEHHGFIRSYDRDAGMPERGGRPRRFYGLTDAGRQRLRREGLG